MDISSLPPFLETVDHRAERAGASPFDLRSMVHLTPAPATLATSLARADWGDVKVHRLDLAHGAHLRITAEADTCLWGLILYRSAAVTLSGSNWKPQEIVMLRGGKFELCANGPGAFVLIEAPERDVPGEIVDEMTAREAAFLTCGPSTELLRDCCSSVFWLGADRQSAESTAALRNHLLTILRRTIRFAEIRRPGDACRGRIELVRRAEAFMWEHVDEPLELERIAEAIHCSPRTLVYCFNRCFGCGPMGFFRLQRLNAARHALLVHTTRRRVIDIAVDYGFWHQGHFGTAYRRLFGETPAHTYRISATKGAAPAKNSARECARQDPASFRMRLAFTSGAPLGSGAL
jgi:AraC-like DNA-binding protein